MIQATEPKPIVHQISGLASYNYLLIQTKAPRNLTQLQMGVVRLF